MDTERAQTLLGAERRRIEALLEATARDGASDRDAADEPGEIADPAERLTAEQVDDAILSGLHERLGAITRAEERLAAGNFGRSLRSGAVIPDERLEADPAAELTAEEAAGPA